ncbi:MAG TPA: NAD(P)H-dependent oxidoreductase subunit E, partial [Desulfobacterales bacterium]|nr:NAD(P)H-dependent oxidoreductase subunit E [Desulfobacterales bacterium]
MAEALVRSNVMVCEGTGCTASQTRELLNALKEEIACRGLDGEVRTVQTGCRGFCAMGPIVTVYPEGIFYCRVRPEDVAQLVDETLVNGRIVERLTYQEPLEHKAIPHYSEIPFYTKQQRIALRNCGMIDPEDIREYIARDGYTALAKVLGSMTPAQVLAEVKASGLRGRGGAGFPTGLKWEFTSRSPGDPKYVVCNADEGDPGAFMDRSIIEGDPHSLLEGMTIAGYAIGARHGYVYCRAEYPLAVTRLHVAIAQAQELGLLGANILGSDFSFELEVKE